MLLNELFLKEAINQTLVIATTRALNDAFNEFLKGELIEVSRFMGVQKYIDQYVEYDKNLDPDMRYQDNDLWKYRDRIVDNWHSEKLSKLPKDDHFRQETISEMIHILELTLQDVARDYMEEKFGKIEPIAKRQLDFDEFKNELATKNLVWLEHIIVHLDYSSEQKSGGHFNTHASSSEYNTRYAQSEINPQTDLSQAIKVFVDDDKLWAAFVVEIRDAVVEEYYGEGFKEENLFLDWAADVAPTFVHEVVHMEQEARLQMKLQKTGEHMPVTGRIGRTLLPNPEKKRVRVDGVLKGRKGGVDRRIDNGHPNDPNYDARWADYLGDPNEIDAHAAGYAAKLILAWLKERDRYRHHGSSFESDLNYYVDSVVADLTKGWTPEDYSLQSYKRFIHSKSANNRAYQKVWNRFLKRLATHLLSHKKAPPKKGWRERSKEDRLYSYDEPHRPNLP